VAYRDRAAENALLKTLEEPPPKSLLILIANAPGALLPTTRSRCRKLALKPLNPENMAQAMAALDPDGGKPGRETLSALAEGAPGRALALGQGEALALFSDAVRMLTTMARPDLGVVSAIADRLAKPAATMSFHLYLEMIGQLLRWMVLAKAGRPDALLALGKDGQALLQASQRGTLERWTALWDNLNASFLKADALNLDKRHTIVDAFLEAEAALR
jgi:DNA polymerase III subunit delta'